MNDYLLDVGNKLNEAPIVFKDKQYHIPELDLLPDGGYYIEEANEKKLKYNI